MQNDYVTNSEEYRLQGAIMALMQGIQCFDCEYYREASQDLPPEFTCDQLFQHYINHGQFEGRSYRHASPTYLIFTVHLCSGALCCSFCAGCLSVETLDSHLVRVDGAGRMIARVCHSLVSRAVLGVQTHWASCMHRWCCRMKCIIPASELMPFTSGPELTAAMPHVSEERLQELMREQEARLLQQLPDNGLGAEAADAFAARNVPLNQDFDDELRALPMFQGLGAGKRATLSAEGEPSTTGSQALGSMGAGTAISHAGRGLSGVLDDVGLGAHGLPNLQARRHRVAAGTQYMNPGTRDLVFR